MSAPVAGNLTVIQVDIDEHGRVGNYQPHELKMHWRISDIPTDVPPA